MNQTPKGRIRWAVAALAIAASAALPATAGASSARSQVIVQLDAGSSADAVKAQVREYGGRVTGDLPIINGFSAKLSDGAAASLQRFDGVRAVTRTPRSSRRASTSPSSQTAYPSSVDAIEAWNKPDSNVTGKNVGVAVIDTGIAGQMKDFEEKGPSKALARRRLRRDQPGRDQRQGHLRPRHARRGHHRRQRHRAHQRRPAPEQVHRRRAGGRPGLGQGLRRPRQRDRARRDLRPAVRRRPQGRATTSASSTCRSSPRRPSSYKTDPLDAAVESAWLKGLVVVAAAGNRGTDADAVQYAPGNDPYVISVGALDDQASQADGDDSRATWSSRGVTQDGFAKPEIHAPGARIVSTLAPGSVFSTLCPTCIVERPDDPGRRHLDGGADGLGRGGPAAAEVPEPDAEPGQGRPDRLLAPGQQPLPRASTSTRRSRRSPRATSRSPTRA